MRFQNAHVPYGCYWSTPFCKWQGSFASLHPVHFAAETAKRALHERSLEAGQFNALYLGMTIPAPHSFYGAPWMAGLIGGPGLTGPTISQACATSAQLLASAALRVGSSHGEALLGITTDRTSNGPHMLYPNPLNPGAQNDTEHWVWDNFNCDPLGRNSMIETGENVAREHGITTEQQHEVVLLRHSQYQKALEDDSAFLRRFMIVPVEVNPSGKRVLATVKGDEGVFPSTIEGLEKLRPMMKGGTITFGGQTYPADGNAGMIVATQ